MDEAALQDRRRKNLRAWITAQGGIREAFKGRFGVPASYESYLSQVLSGHSFGSRGARTCEGRLGMPSLWLDADHDASGAARTGAVPVDATPARSPASVSLAQALELVVDAVSALPAARWTSIRAQLDSVAGRPEMRDDVVSELQHLLSAPPSKRTGAE